MSIPFLSIATAYAQQAGGPPPLTGTQLFMQQYGQIGLMVVIFAIIYFLIMRPQQQKQKQHQEMLRNLQKGDRVLTQAGVYGTVASLDEKSVMLQVAERVQVKIARWSVAEKITEDSGA